MANFKFVCRESELQEVLSSVKKNTVVVLNSQDNSGLTHFLKKIVQLHMENDMVCFYIDGESQLKISDQIIGQVAMLSQNDSPNKNNVSKLLLSPSKKDLVYSIVTSCLYALDAIPVFPVIGTIANSLISSIKETLDTDFKHLEDYKTEKAIIKFCEKLSGKYNKNIHLIIDNPHKLKSDEYPFLSVLLNTYKAHVLFAFNTNDILDSTELFSKLFHSNEYKVTKVSEKFKRPDNTLIEELYHCYGKEYSPKIIKFFEAYERDIHVIMSYINGFSLDILSDFSDDLLYLLKILYVINRSVPYNLVLMLWKEENLHSFERTHEMFQELCNKATQLGLIKIEDYLSDKRIELTFNKVLLAKDILSISYADSKKIIEDAIRYIDLQKDSMDVSMLEFAILHLEHDYTHRKQYIMLLSRMQYRKRSINLNYLDKLNYFEDSEELFFVCGLYYDLGIYDKPYRLLQTHSNFSRKQKYKIMQALICERRHTDDYVHKLETIIERTKNCEKRVLLTAVLFVAYLNSDDSKKFQCFFEEGSKYYYKQSENCTNYPYLLRNITYYIEDIPTAISNYEKCLSSFECKDPVNYNRTISNYICYLMRHDSDTKAKLRLSSIAIEVCKILDYNDPAYAYLNINYGIYLMRYTDEDPSVYFCSIPCSAGTTETPYIYAQVNLALYYSKVKPLHALKIMNLIEEKVKETSVPRTRQFYIINRALIEAINGNFPQELIREILNKPLRGNKIYAQKLCDLYSTISNSKELYEQYFNQLSLPGYLFYRYFPAEYLLSEL